MPCFREREWTMRNFKVGLVQMNSGREIGPNIEAASRLVREARGQGAELVVTPENTTMVEPRRKLILGKARSEGEHPAISDLQGACGRDRSMAPDRFAHHQAR